MIQIYEMSDAGCQERAIKALAGVEGVSAEPADNGPDWFVVVSITDGAQARSTHAVLRGLDPGAILIDNTHAADAGVAHLLSQGTKER